jgi:hypothetical protein
MIDRRQCVTGLAAAAILPALPAVAQADAPARLTPMGWLARMHVRSWMAHHNAYDETIIGLVSRWHYEEPAFHRLTIRHIDTALAFAFSLRAAPAAESEADRYIAAVQLAASCVAGHACQLLASRPQHRRAVFFRYRPDADPVEPFFRPIVEDAPPLPPVDAGLQPAGISETAPCPYFSRIMRDRYVDAARARLRASSRIVPTASEGAT